MTWSHTAALGIYSSSCGRFVVMKHRRGHWELYLKRPCDLPVNGVLEYGNYLTLKAAQQTAQQIVAGSTAPCLPDAAALWQELNSTARADSGISSSGGTTASEARGKEQGR